MHRFPGFDGERGSIGHRLTVLLLFAALLFSTSAHADSSSSWSILKYDDNGRVIGVSSGRREGEKNKAAQDKDASEKAPKKQERTKAIESREILVAEPPPGMLHRVQSMGYEVIDQWTLGFLRMTLVRLKAPKGKSIPEALIELRAEFPLANIDTNDLMDLSTGPAVDRRIQIAEAADYSRRTVGWGRVPASCGRGMKIGMIDGAVDVNHAALTGQDLAYRNFIKKDRKPAADDHGTAVAVMLIGNPETGNGGLLPAAKLYAANIFEFRKRGPTGNLAAMIRAVDWIGKSGAKVVNLSIAGSQNTLMRLAINRSVQAGLVMVAAAGNKGPGAEPVWPAAHDDAFAITAIDEKLKRYKLANIGSYIDFAAPGVDIRIQTPRGSRLESGTSMATPFITAVVAIHLAAGFDSSPGALRESMKRYVRDLGQKGHDEKFGWGLVRIRPKC